ncbi:hypothetical protein TNCV_4307421 [Trichonephila clavipes]|nr:hypothetical protein TNCV_4307421 [Trichonephila clavipes]
MSVLSQPAYFAHANVFHHEGKPVPSNCPIATIPRGWQRSRGDVHHRESCRSTLQSQRCSIQLPRKCPSSSDTPPVTQECARGIPALCVRGKFSQLARGNRGLDGGQRIKTTKMFQRARTVCHGPENLPNFKDICDGTFPDPMHEGVHEEEDISYCTMVKSYQFAKYLQQFNKVHAEWSYKVSVLTQ